MKSAGSIMFFSVVCAIVFLATHSCNTKKDYSAEVRALDSLSGEIEAAFKLLHDAKPDSTAGLRDSIGGQLKYVQENFVGTMKKDMAAALGEYSVLKKDLENVHDIGTQLEEERKLTSKQLADLRQALSEGATHDAQNNPMTEEYVRKVLRNEIENASALIIEVNDLVTRRDVLRTKYEANYPKVKFWVDSIPEQKRDK